MSEPRRRELLQALGIFQGATPDQLWKLTRPDNQHDKLTRDNLLDLEEHHLVRIESVQEDQRQVWVLAKRGHGEAKKLLEPKGIRVSVLREAKCHPITGELLGTGYDDHAAAVTSTAAELHRVGIGHRLGFQTETETETGHRLGNGFVQRADLVVRAPAVGRKDRDRFISGKSKQNAVKTMVVTDGEGRVLFCSPAKPGSCADITHARQLGLVKLLANGPAVQILADGGYRGLGAQTGGRVVTPPHRKFKKNAPGWYEEMHEHQRKAHSSRRIRVEHGIAHLKNWRALARHLGRREHMSDTVQAIAALLSHQQIADLTSARQT